MPRWLLRVIAVVLIAAVASAILWPLAIRPYLRGIVGDELRKAVTTEIAAIDQLPILPTGDLVVTEAEINDHLRANPADFAPATDPRLTITPDGLRFGFSLYGLNTAYTGYPVVVDDRLVVRDGRIEGPAAQLLTAQEVAALIEEQFALMLDRAGLGPTAVDLGDGLLRVSTDAASSAKRDLLVAPSGERSSLPDDVIFAEYSAILIDFAAQAIYPGVE